MSNKRRVIILCGGKSAEHEISLLSARSVVNAIDPELYEPSVVFIDRRGRWFLLNAITEIADLARLANDEIEHRFDHIALTPGAPEGPFFNMTKRVHLHRIDLVFPVLHGPFGEDGTMQGLLKLLDVPFVGASVLGSAVGMDKIITKRLLQQAGIPVARFVAFSAADKSTIDPDNIIGQLGLPLFVKPANLGSSVGISKVSSAASLNAAIDEAFNYDRWILVEEMIHGREIECSVFGNEHPTASLPGEIVAHHDFYSYEAKYVDEKGADLIIPAQLPEHVTRKIRKIAVDACVALATEGMARVDFFLTPDERCIVNEINTIPGFTSISMYPKLWHVTGMPYRQLITKLFDLALDRFQHETRLRISCDNPVQS